MQTCSECLDHSLVDSEASGDYFDDEPHPDLKVKLQNDKPLKIPHKIVTEGRYGLLRTVTGTVSDKNIDAEGNKHQVNIEGMLFPGLGHHRFCTSQATKTGITTMIDSPPRLKQDQDVLPIHQLNMNLELFSFNLESAETARYEGDLPAIRVPSDTYHRPMRHIRLILR